MSAPFNMWSGQSNTTSQVSVGTQIKVWFDSLPLVTRSVFIVCTTVYVVGLFAGFDRSDQWTVCLSAYFVVQKFQVYRLLTAVIFHVGILHLAFNMIAFVGSGKFLERQIGTVQFLHLLLMISVVSDVLYVGISYAAYYAPFGLFGDHVIHSCAVGLSGVIFALIVVENELTQATTRSIFGWFSVNAKLYPWLLLILWQLIMPGVSFLGHLCGVLVGQFYVWGWLNALKLPSSWVARIEESRLLSRCYSMDCFIAHTGAALPTSYPASSTGNATGLSGVSFRDWLRGGWSAVPSDDPSPSGSSQPQSNNAAGGPFVGRPYKLSDAASGSTTAASSTVRSNSHGAPAAPLSGHAGTPSNSTLAAAAEARLSRMQSRGTTDKSGAPTASSGKAADSSGDSMKSSSTSSESTSSKQR